MKNDKILLVLKELYEKSKNCKDGLLAPELCKIKISELVNFDITIYSELSKIERLLWEKEVNNIETEKFSVPILQIKDSYIMFYPVIIREYLKEMNE